MRVTSMLLSLRTEGCGREVPARRNWIAPAQSAPTARSNAI